MVFFSRIPSVLFFAVVFLGGIFYVIVYELAALIINLWQVLILGYSFAKMSDYVSLQMPSVGIRFLFGVFSLILIGLLIRTANRHSIRRYRKRHFAFLRQARKQYLNIDGRLFTTKLRRKYDKLLKERLLHQKATLDSTDFEYFVAFFAFRSGFSPVYVTPQGHDYGLDVITTYRKKTYGIQAKFYGQHRAVDISAVQQAVAGSKAYGLDQAVVVTTSTFTENAYTLARATNTILIDGRQLNHWEEYPEYIFRLLQVDRFPKWLLNSRNTLNKLTAQRKQKAAKTKK